METMTGGGSQAEGLESSHSPLETWLAQHQLSHLAPVFKKHAIDIDVLFDLSAADLAELGLQLGDRKRVLKALAEGVPAAAAATDRPLPAERRQPPRLTGHCQRNGGRSPSSFAILSGHPA